MTRLSRPARGGRALRRGLAIALAVGGLSLVSACQADEDPNLAALKREKIVSFQPTDGVLDFEGEDTEHVALGKPVRAMVLRVFLFRGASDASRARRDAIEEAQADGWIMGRRAASPRDAAFGAKTLETGDATLTIDDYTTTEGPKLLIRIEQRPCPAGLCG